MDRIPIDQVARRAGLTASALRFYESEGLIPAAPRAGGRRIYPPEILDRLAVIRLAQAAGFTIAEIRDLLHGIDRRRPAAQAWRRLASRKLDELDRRIEEAARMKAVLRALVECDCPTLDDCGRALDATLPPAR